MRRIRLASTGTNGVASRYGILQLVQSLMARSLLPRRGTRAATFGSFPRRMSAGAGLATALGIFAGVALLVATVLVVGSRDATNGDAPTHGGREGLIALLSRLTEVSLQAGDYATLRSSIQSVADSSEIQHILVADGRDRIVAASDGSRIGAPYTDHLRPSDGSLVTRDLWLDDERLGLLEVVFVPVPASLDWPLMRGDKALYLVLALVAVAIAGWTLLVYLRRSPDPAGEVSAPPVVPELCRRGEAESEATDQDDVTRLGRELTRVAGELQRYIEARRHTDGPGPVPACRRDHLGLGHRSGPASPVSALCRDARPGRGRRARSLQHLAQYGASG